MNEIKIERIEKNQWVKMPEPYGYSKTKIDKIVEYMKRENLESYEFEWFRKKYRVTLK